MKILMAGDIHGDLPHAQYLVKTAKKQGCDRIFQLGDFGHWPHYRDGVVFLNQLSLYADLNNILVYWVDGNHDSVSRVYENHGRPEDLDDEGFIKVRKQIRYAPRGHRWIWDGCRFIALGGAWSVDKDWRVDEEAKKARKKREPGAFANTLWFPEEQMTDEDMWQILEDSCRVDVIVAHDKPRGSNPGWNRKDFPECLPNQDRLQNAIRVLQPAAFFHGHLHHNYTDAVAYSSAFDGGLEVVLVTGLHCNPDAAEYGRPYDKKASWQVFDTSTIGDLRKMNAEVAESWSSTNDDDIGQTVDVGAGPAS